MPFDKEFPAIVVQKHEEQGIGVCVVYGFDKVFINESAFAIFKTLADDHPIRTGKTALVAGEENPYLVSSEPDEAQNIQPKAGADDPYLVNETAILAHLLPKSAKERYGIKVVNAGKDMITVRNLPAQKKLLELFDIMKVNVCIATPNYFQPITAMLLSHLVGETAAKKIALYSETLSYNNPHERKTGPLGRIRFDEGIATHGHQIFVDDNSECIEHAKKYGYNAVKIHTEDKTPAHLRTVAIGAMEAVKKRLQTAKDFRCEDAEGAYANAIAMPDKLKTQVDDGIKYLDSVILMLKTEKSAEKAIDHLDLKKFRKYFTDELMTFLVAQTKADALTMKTATDAHLADGGFKPIQLPSVDEIKQLTLPENKSRLQTSIEAVGTTINKNRSALAQRIHISDADLVKELYAAAEAHVEQADNCGYEKLRAQREESILSIEEVMAPELPPLRAASSASESSGDESLPGGQKKGKKGIKARIRKMLGTGKKSEGALSGSVQSDLCAAGATAGTLEMLVTPSAAEVGKEQSTPESVRKGEKKKTGLQLFGGKQKTSGSSGKKF